MKKKLLISIGVALIVGILGALLGDEDEATKTPAEATVIEGEVDAIATEEESSEYSETAETSAPEFHSIVDYSSFDAGANSVIKDYNKQADRPAKTGEVKMFFISKSNGIASMKVAESRYEGINAGDTIQVDVGEVKYGNFSLTFFDPAANENGVWKRKLIP